MESDLHLALDLTPVAEANIDNTSNVSYLSDAQESALAFIPIVCTVFSLFASCLLIRLLVKRGFKSPMRRILITVAFTDIFMAVTATLQAFLVPKDTSRRLYAMGNDASCTYLGWGFTFSTMSFCYYGALSFYFLMVVKFGMKDSVFARKIEPFMHVFIWVFCLSTSTVGLAMGLYGEVPVGTGCWLRVTDTCDGDCVHLYEGIMGGFPFVLSLIMVIVNNTLIFCHVRNTIYESIKKSQERWAENLEKLRISMHISDRLSLSNRVSSSLSGSKRSSNSNSMRPSGLSLRTKTRRDVMAAIEAEEREEAERARKQAEKEAKAAKKAAEKKEREEAKAAKIAAARAKIAAARAQLVKQATVSPEQSIRVKRVGIQSLFYCLVFLITYSWTTVLNTYRNSVENGDSPEVEPLLFPYMILRAIFIPSMGIWNLLIYVRPRYCTLRDQEMAKVDGESSWKSLCRVVWDVDAGIIGVGRRGGRAKYGSTKTQLYKGSTKSNFSTSAQSVLGVSTQSLPSTIMNRMDSTPMILERGESTMSNLGASMSNFGSSRSQMLATPEPSFRVLLQTNGSQRTQQIISEDTEGAETARRRESTHSQLTETQREDSLSQDELSDDN